jgi:hypothetical protein
MHKGKDTVTRCARLTDGPFYNRWHQGGAIPLAHGTT